MGKDSGKRATRKRIADVSAAARDDAAQLRKATTRRLAKLEKDLTAVHRTEERRRSRLAAASAEADRIRTEIADLIRHASEPAADGARKVGHAAGGLLEDAADVVTGAAGGVAHAAGSVIDAAGSVVGAARRATRAKPASVKAPASAKPAAIASPAKAPAKARAAKAPAKARAAKAPAKVPAKPATPRQRGARKAPPPATGPGNG